jgi:hypothetical protein
VQEKWAEGSLLRQIFPYKAIPHWGPVARIR